MKKRWTLDKAIPQKLIINEALYKKHCDEYDGYCLACESWTSGGVEPDACEYRCEACEQNAVYGAEELSIMDLIEFE